MCVHFSSDFIDYATAYMFYAVHLIINNKQEVC